MRRFWLCGTVVFAVAGCDPYKDYKLNGEFNAGSVDPANFAPPYRGAGANRSVAGSGTGFSAAPACAQGAAVEYFLFPFSPTQVVRAGYPGITPANQMSRALSVRPPYPNAYVFQPSNNVERPRDTNTIRAGTTSTTTSRARFSPRCPMRPSARDLSRPGPTFPSSRRLRSDRRGGPAQNTRG